MAITSDAAQAVIDPTELQLRIQQSNFAGTLQTWFVKGGIDFCSRSRWVTSLASDNAATQGAAIIAAMQEG